MFRAELKQSLFRPAAEWVGEMAGFPEAQGAERMLPVARGVYRAQATGMYFAADGSAAVVVTYGEVLVYPKTKDETWAEALVRTEAHRTRST
ncbi:MAG: hypothetical protein H7067_20250 [Burkholderiales bacterium]|nr:hypothetical protein [Opitutaceae bacterium]